VAAVTVPASKGVRCRPLEAHGALERFRELYQLTPQRNRFIRLALHRSYQLCLPLQLYLHGSLRRLERKLLLGTPLPHGSGSRLLAVAAAQLAVMLGLCVEVAAGLDISAPAGALHRPLSTSHNWLSCGCFHHQSQTDTAASAGTGCGGGQLQLSESRSASALPAAVSLPQPGQLSLGTVCGGPHSCLKVGVPQLASSPASAAWHSLCLSGGKHKLNSVKTKKKKRICSF